MKRKIVKAGVEADLVNFVKSFKLGRDGNDQYMAIVAGDDTLRTMLPASMPTNFPSDDLVFPIRINQLERLANAEGVATVAYAASLLKLQGCLAVFDIEERIVGETLEDEEGQPVLDAAGNHVTFNGDRLHDQPGERYYAPVNVQLQYGEHSLTQIRKMLEQRELTAGEKADASFVPFARKKTAKRVSFTVEDIESVPAKFVQPKRLDNETDDAYVLRVAEARNQFNASQAKIAGKGSDVEQQQPDTTGKAKAKATAVKSKE